MPSESYVLVVDASEDCCLLLEKFLRTKCRLAAVGLGSGQQALELVARREPLLIILDLKVPDIPSSELIRLLRQPPRGPQRILIGTGTYTSEETLRLLKAGLLDAFLRKPVDLGRLTDIVLKLLPRLQPDFH